MSSKAELPYGTVKNFIAGEWRTPDGDGQRVVNPATSDAIADIKFSSAKTVDDAVRAGQSAFS